MIIQDNWLCPACNADKNSQGDILCSARAVVLHIAGKIKSRDYKHRKWAEDNLGDFIYEDSIYRSINTLASEFFDIVLQENKMRLIKEEERIREIIDERDSQHEPRVIAFRYIEKIETGLHGLICQVLKEAFGEDEKGWWVKGVPTQIRIACVQRREEDLQREEAYNYTDILHFKKIIGCNRELFKNQFQLIQKESIAANEFLNNMAKLNEIRNRVAHTTRSQITQEDVHFIKDYFNSVQIFTQLDT